MRVKFLKKIAMIFGTLLIVLNQSSNAIALTSSKLQGDDPGVTIQSPDSINSQGLVDLNVTLSASAGNLKENGTVEVKIPKNIVADPTQLRSMIKMTDPFYLDNPAYSDDGSGNYILNVKYDASKINQNEAVGYTFTVEFKAPYFTDNTKVPENIDFNTNLNIAGNTVSTAMDNSKTIPSTTGNPAFVKYSGSDSINNNGVKQYIMSPTDSQLNNFVVVFNYNHQTYEDATITDTLPNGLSLADTYPIPVFNGAPGNPARVNHLYIYRVTVDDTGKVTNPQLVTDSFASEIQATSKGFSLHLGKVESNESYAITYGGSVNSGYNVDNFGTQYNHATLSNNGVQMYEREVPLIMQDLTPSATGLTKKVSQSELATNSASLVYTLTLSNYKGALKAGTVVSDPLPNYVSYDSTVQNDGFSDATYNKDTNTISYTLLNDLPQGESKEIQVKVNFINKSAHIGDKIINKASYTYAGSTIYSNDAVTILSGSAILQKLDSKTDAPLAGAVFKVIDNQGNMVVDNLVTGSDGKVNSGLLAPGEYSFVETKAPEGYVLDSTPNKFTVTSNQETQVDLTMYNTQSITISGTKTWIDDNDSKKLRPKTITIELYRDDQKFASTKIGAVDSWKYSFSNLPKYDKNGKEFIYTVKEVPVKNYTSEQKGFDFVNTLNATTTPSTTPPSSKSLSIPAASSNSLDTTTTLPKTGDTMLNSFIGVFLGSLLIMGTTALLALKYRRGKIEK
ncbi:Cna B-type domain-containing protein [Lactococcus sp. S64]|uniref:Cna B-type domain-containing protein n=1 Tax=Lactococcus sp. S64 TaxID=2767459 RepID=UPI0019033E24|nr:Cna B-type domain-containing protein [Lactococcus sp. S64]MBK0083037.1 Cna B-type domain-containing protein [Lactococcus sp. S64]